MGSAKEEMMNNLEYNREKKLAKILGITYDELNETNWHFDEEKSEEGLVYHILVKFDKDSPKEILDKINGLDNNFTVCLEPDELDNQEDYEDEELGGEG